jgi:hypothetical protein
MLKKLGIFRSQAFEERQPRSQASKMRQLQILSFRNNEGAYELLD